MINVCDVGKRIKELRISSNLTQDKIAEYLSLNQSMIAKMEKVKGISRRMLLRNYLPYFVVRLNIFCLANKLNNSVSYRLEKIK